MVIWHNQLCRIYRFLWKFVLFDGFVICKYMIVYCRIMYEHYVIKFEFLFSRNSLIVTLIQSVHINIEDISFWEVMVFNFTFNTIWIISWQSLFLMEVTGVPGENHWPVASQWQSLSHNVVSSTPRHNRNSNSWLHWSHR